MNNDRNNDEKKEDKHDLILNYPPKITFDDDDEYGDCDNAESVKKKVRKGVCVLSVITALICTICVFTMKNINSDDKELPVTETAEEWRGAFKDFDTCQHCFNTAVTVRLGAYGEYGAISTSGFVIDSNGWIASSNALLKTGQKGRIYVRLKNGKEFPVDEIRQSDKSGIAFMHIDTIGLDAATEGNPAELCVGEDLVSVSSHGGYGNTLTLSVGVVTDLSRTVFLEESGKRKEGLLSTNMEFGFSDMGCPVFDVNGKVVAVALYEDTGFVCPINNVCTEFRRLKSN